MGWPGHAEWRRLFADRLQRGRCQEEDRARRIPANIFPQHLD
jgi:hypothetical protein